VTYDAIVIGVGGMGSAALYHLARRGARVLGLEQFALGHDRGSSHGVTRIIRLAYAEDPRYVPLVRRAYQLWRELEERAGEPLLFITGGIDAGREGSALLTGSVRSCAEHQIPHEVLDAETLNRRFPGYRFPPELISVYQPEAGFVLAERSLVSHVALAREMGATVHTGERVHGWDRDGESLEVQTDRGRYRASRLVVTAGPWAGTLVPALASLVVPERQIVLWTRPLEPEHFEAGRFPIFYMEADEGRFYGLPIHATPGFKIGKYHHRGERADPDRPDPVCHPEDEAVLREGIRRYFPSADGPTLASQACLFTNTADEHFIIDRHPDDDRVVMAAGFSGHGYKFCSVVGEILTDLTLESGTSWDVGLFRLARLVQ
jgi:sarcosine oxidase